MRDTHTFAIGLLAWAGAACGGGAPPAAAPPVVTAPEKDRELVLKQELGELPTPKGPCPERVQKDVLENPRAPVQRTALGLAYCILHEGPAGTVPGTNDTVRVHYTGWTIDGTMFDSSVERGAPIDLPLNGVIRGWTEGLRLMTPGDKARLWIPGNLGYGRREPGAEAGTPPKGTLIFDIELIEVMRAPPEPKPPTEPTEPTETAEPEDDSKPRLVPRDPPPPLKAPNAG
jgi:hypothetical protein